MPKSYTEELAEWVKKREAMRHRQDKNVVAFLAVRPDIQAAIEAGYSLKTIWEHMHEVGRIGYRYETFIKHVRRHITHAPPKPKPLQPETTITTTKAREQEHAPTQKKSESKIDGFTFNATPTREELI